MAAVNAALNLNGGDSSEDDGAAAMDADVPGPAAAAPSAAAGAGAGGGAPGPIAASDLAAVLGSIMSGSGGAGGAGGLAAALAARQRVADPGPGLGEVLKPELVAPLLRSPEMVARLAPYLPEEHRWVGRPGRGRWGQAGLRVPAARQPGGGGERKAPAAPLPGLGRPPPRTWPAFLPAHPLPAHPLDPWPPVVAPAGARPRLRSWSAPRSSATSSICSATVGRAGLAGAAG